VVVPPAGAAVPARLERLLAPAELRHNDLVRGKKPTLGSAPLHGTRMRRPFAPIRLACVDDGAVGEYHVSYKEELRSMDTGRGSSYAHF
jgi:hypothetical protein